MPIYWITDDPSLQEPEEMYGTAQESLADDKISASVQLKCLWDERHLVVDNILSTPLAWPYHLNDVAFAKTAGVQPFPGEPSVADGSGLVYEHALLTLNFETRQINDDEGSDFQLYSEAIEPTAEFITVPHTDFRWGAVDGDPLRPEEAPGRLEIGFDYVLTYYNLTEVPAAFLTLIGKCNNGGVPSSFFAAVFPAETLLFNPPSISRNVSTEGDNLFTVKTRLTYRSSGWNTFWRAKTGSFAQMYHKDGGGTAYKNFTPADFTDILP